MKKTRVLIGALALSCLITVPAYAAEWKQDSKGWWWQEDNGSYPTSSWKNIGGKYYYFGADGYMLHDTTTPDGYKVGSDGAWIEKTMNNEDPLASQLDENGEFTEAAREEIWKLVKSATKVQLKNPKSAKFPDANDEEVRIYLKDGEIWVWGYAEAKNGFGNYMDANISATVYYLPGEGYRCKDCLVY